MLPKIGRSLVYAGALLLATSALADPLETSVAKAQAMLIHEDLGGGVHVFRAPGDLDYWTSTNSVVVIDDEDVVVFDSPTRAVTAKAVIAEIRKLTPKPVRVLVNSHWHQDHWSGNDEYVKAYPGLRIVASEETRDYMKRMPAAYFLNGLETAQKTRRAELATAIQTGKLPDGSPLTPEARAKKEEYLGQREQFMNEVAALPRFLPNVVYRDTMTFWSGRREFRLMSVTGDATGSTVMFLPAEKILATGDVLPSPEDGKGPPPWTTNSYSVTPWLETLRRLDALEPAAIVPGQGPAMRDRTYLERTIQLFAAVIDQVHAALERGVVGVEAVQKSVNVDRIADAYAPDAAKSEEFHHWLQYFSKKAMQEALDGAIGER
jgi:glyoxylase-like metal-dependent hydrolase (beta-lactamase superfamily II)